VKEKERRVTTAYLRRLFDYDPDAGSLKWRIARQGIRPGWEAGYLCTGDGTRHGYRLVMVDGVFHMVHRVAWTHFYGEWPRGAIDHINGKRTDNRIQNLRVATLSENQHNRHRVAKNNKSGTTGVHWDRRKRKWRTAAPQLNGQRETKLFKRKDAAIAARSEYEQADPLRYLEAVR